MILLRVRVLKKNIKLKKINKSLRRILGFCLSFQLYNIVKRVIATIISVEYNEPNLTVYTQSAFNQSTLLLQSEQLSDLVIREAENLVRRYQRKKEENKAFKIRVQNKIFLITNFSAYTFIRSETYDKKLDNIIIQTYFLIKTE